MILLGRITGVFGVRGEIKIESWTEPRLAIFRYQPWILTRAAVSTPMAGVRGRNHGQALAHRLQHDHTKPFICTW